MNWSVYQNNKFVSKLDDKGSAGASTFIPIGELVSGI